MMEQELTQPQKFQRIQTFLSTSNVLKTLLSLVKSITDKHTDYASSTFCKSDHFKFLKSEIEKIRMPELNQMLSQIKAPPCIIALPIKREQKFTLFFVIVPEGQKFDWHNHPKMTGLSKCIHGGFKISVIDYHFLQAVGPQQYTYPKQHIRIQSLDLMTGPTVSIIQPHAYNIHKIQARQLSAFFDLLTPDYPDNTCQFLTTTSQSSDKLFLQELSVPPEQVDGWDVYMKQLVNREKYIVKNVILQSNK